MANNVFILAAFFLYLIMMIVIGARCSANTKNTEDFYLGGRQLNGWVAAMSAQAADMSGWLLMGLPGAIYLYGLGEAWIGIGLFIGTTLNWLIVSKRIRRYTIKANNAITLPMFFENRYRDKSRFLLGISSGFIALFFLVYTASAFASGGKLISAVFGLDYHAAATIGALVILVYTFLGGFMAVCETDFIQGLLMLVGLFMVPIVACITLGFDNVSPLLEQSGVTGGVASFSNIMEDGGEPIRAVTIISNLGWGLGYFGMPHILTKFMAVSNEKELQKSKVIAIVWVAISLSFACLIGWCGRAYMMPEVLDGTNAEKIFIRMIMKMFTSQFALPLIGGVFLCGILAAIMSTADSQLLITSCSLTEDIYRGIINPKAPEKTALNLSRYTVLVVAIVAYIIAWDPNSSVMGLVSNAWAGLGATFGPVVLLSLFWRRANRQGAIAGMLGGGLTVIVWDYLPLIGGKTIGGVTGLYSLIPGFFLGLLAMYAVSLATPAPSEEIVKEFDEVANLKEGEI